MSLHVSVCVCVSMMCTRTAVASARVGVVSIGVDSYRDSVASVELMSRLHCYDFLPLVEPLLHRQRVVRVGRFQVTDSRRVPVLPVQVAIQFKEVDKASGVGRVAREDRVFVHVLRVARFVPAGGAGGAGERRSGRVGE